MAASADGSAAPKPRLVNTFWDRYGSRFPTVAVVTGVIFAILDIIGIGIGNVLHVMFFGDDGQWMFITGRWIFIGGLVWGAVATLVVAAFGKPRIET